MAKYSDFEKDFEAAQESFPKLISRYNKKLKKWVITGDLDICDLEGVYWGTFNIALIVPQSYPYGVPDLYEISKIIPREPDFHMGDNGSCCVDIHHNLEYHAKRGIRIMDYMLTWAYPFFANQLYRMREKRYAGAEYAHQKKGVVQYYAEELNLSTDQAINVLKSILTHIGIGRNDPCPCGRNEKLKRCHKESVERLKSLTRQRLQEDLDYFVKHFQMEAEQKHNPEIHQLYSVSM